VDRYFPNIFAQGIVRFSAIDNPDMFTRGAGAPDVSGTKMRDILPDETKRLEFLSGLPKDLSDESKESIYTRLRSRIKETKEFNDAMLEAFFRGSKKRPEQGTKEYSDYLEEMMDELKHIKSGYDSRKKVGARYRKEASKIQDAYSELRRLKRKNDKLLITKSIINEAYRAIDLGYDVKISNEETEEFTRDTIKDFFRQYRRRISRKD